MLPTNWLILAQILFQHKNENSPRAFFCVYIHCFSSCLVCSHSSSYKAETIRFVLNRTFSSEYQLNVCKKWLYLFLEQIIINSLVWYVKYLQIHPNRVQPDLIIPTYPALPYRDTVSPNFSFTISCQIIFLIQVTKKMDLKEWWFSTY